jgi:uncharacterized membrane protein YczE
MHIISEICSLKFVIALTPGSFIAFIGLVALIVVLILRERIGWDTLANVIFIGPWEDLALSIIPSVKDNLPVQIAFYWEKHRPTANLTL